MEPARAELVAIGKYRYLFFKIGDAKVATLLFPCYRVEIVRGGLSLRLLNVATIMDYLEKHPGTLEHEWRASRGLLGGMQPAANQQGPPARQIGSALLITDEPAQVRRFFEAHQDDPDFVVEPMILRDLSPYAFECPSSPKSRNKSGGPAGAACTSTADLPSDATSV